MDKRTRNIIKFAIIFILLLSAGFSINRVVGNQPAALKEEKISDVERVVDHEDTEENEESLNEEATELDTEEDIEEQEVVAENAQEVVNEDKEPMEPETEGQETEVQQETIAPEQKEVVGKEEAEPISEESSAAKQSSLKQEETPVIKEVIQKSNVATTEYLLPYSNSEERVKETSHVVLHFTSNALNNPENPYEIQDTYNIFKEYGVSAHYVIGRSGEIYLFVPENRVAYHAGRGQLQGFPEIGGQLNHYSIGIELLGIGTREEMIPMITAEGFDLIDPTIIGFTEAQYSSLNTLLNDMIARYPGIKKDRNHIVGHDEYSVGTKTDPGSLFNWSKIGF